MTGSLIKFHEQECVDTEIKMKVVQIGLRDNIYWEFIPKHKNVNNYDHSTDLIKAIIMDLDFLHYINDTGLALSDNMIMTFNLTVEVKYQASMSKPLLKEIYKRYYIPKVFSIEY